MDLRPLSAVLLLVLTLPTQAETLPQMVQKVLATHPELLAGRAQLRASEEGLTAAKSGYYPSLSVAVGGGSEWSDNPATRLAGKEVELSRSEAAVMLKQPLYDGGQTSALTERETATVTSRQQQVAELEQQVVLQGVEVYIGVLRAQQELELVKDNLAVHQKIKAQIEQRVKGGAGTDADLKQTEARLALARTRLLVAQSGLQEASARYQRVVGEPPSRLEPLPKISAPLLQQPLESLLTRLRSQSPTLQRAEADIRVSEAEQALMGTPLRPQIALELSTTHHNNIDATAGVNADRLAMVRLNYLLATGGGDFARQRRAAELVESSRQQREKAQRELEERLALYHNQWQMSRDQLPFLQKHADSSTTVRNAYQQQFEVGRRTLLDLLDGENELFTARQTLIRGEFQFQQSEYRLLGLLQALNFLRSGS